MERRGRNLVILQHKAGLDVVRQLGVVRLEPLEGQRLVAVSATLEERYISIHGILTSPMRTHHVDVDDPVRPYIHCVEHLAVINKVKDCVLIDTLPRARQLGPDKARFGDQSRSASPP